MEGRVLAIDPGAKRLGVAISDPFRILSTPLAVIKHESLACDSQKIVDLCVNNEVKLIIIGQPLSASGEVNPQTRHAIKLAEKIMTLTVIPVKLWDESESTSIARKAAIEMGMTRKKRIGHLDKHAAAVILQSYLDAQQDWSAGEA